jgi:hypothetical protein
VGLITGSGKIDFGWSGVAAPAIGSGIVAVSGQWTVPKFAPSVTAGSNCAVWVGIDGKFGAADVVLQAGVACDFSGREPIYAWYEWYPDPLQPLEQSDIRVLSGDVISCSISGKISSNTATIELRNLSSGEPPKSITIQAKSGQVLKGNCAEWVVEALKKNGNPTKLCGYGTVLFSGCTAAEANGNTIDPYDSPGSTAYKLQQNGQVVSYGSCSTPGHVICSQDPAVGGSLVAPNAVATRALSAPNSLEENAIGRRVF